MPLWGQFINRRGEIRKSVADSFLSALARTSNLGDVGECFPFQALTAAAPVREFFDFYQV